MSEISNTAAIYENRFLRAFNIGPKQYQGIHNAKSREEARQYRTVWQKISDWFFGENYRVYDQLNLLLRYSNKDEINLEQLHYLMLAFNELRDCCCYEFEEMFRVNIIDSGQGRFSFSFNIKGLGDLHVPQDDSEHPQAVAENYDREPTVVAYASRGGWEKPLYASTSLPIPITIQPQRQGRRRTQPLSGVQREVENILAHARFDLDMLNQCIIRREATANTLEKKWNEDIRDLMEGTFLQAIEDLQQVDPERKWDLKQVQRRIGKK
ncbi:hypothetical protein [Parashewanella tropica]|uniref:hypothetical protein n=1 Tax=Parashewanella tropica TaxID=2547970 RepID=UPI0010593E9B|nr:hypothetical protein [Parashewanella tropica]